MGYLIGGAGPDADEKKKIVASGKSRVKELSDAQLKRMRAQAIKDISRFDNNQMARKIALNSAYGAIGNQYFRYYKLANAEAITLSGQVSIRWIENKMNQKINKILKTNDVDYVLLRILIPSTLIWVLWLTVYTKDERKLVRMLLGSLTRCVLMNLSLLLKVLTKNWPGM